MTNREEVIHLVWTKRKAWQGTEYRAETRLIPGSHWVLVADRPHRNGNWVVCGWRNGYYSLYVDGRTLADVKKQAENRINELAAQAREGE